MLGILRSEVNNFEIKASFLLRLSQLIHLKYLIKINSLTISKNPFLI